MGKVMSLVKAKAQGRADMAAVGAKIKAKLGGLTAPRSMAGRIPQRFIDEVVARSDIVEIIGARVSLKKAGREYKACCPFHSEKIPSFWVSPDKQFYHCFGCGAHGTVVGFLMQYEKLEFPEAIADLAQRAGLELPREAQSTPRTGQRRSVRAHGRARRASSSRISSDNARAQRLRPSARHRRRDRAPNSAWAMRRTPGTPCSSDSARVRTSAAACCRSASSSSATARGGERQTGFYDRFRDRLMFPIRDSRGRVLGFGGRIIDQGEPKYLNSPETPLFHKGRELYGLYEARQARNDFKRLLIVEGYMDVVRLHQAGITYAVATLGTATTQEHLQQDLPNHERSGVLFRRRSRRPRRRPGGRSRTRCRWRATAAN